MLMTLASGLWATSVDGQGITGRVVVQGDVPVPGAFVTFRNPTVGVSFTAYSDAEGHYTLEGVPQGTYEATARLAQLGRTVLSMVAYDGGDASQDFLLGNEGDRYGSSSTFLNMIPDTEEKRRFIIDCTGCHVLNQEIAFPGGQVRTIREWDEAMTRMVREYGSSAPLPRISEHRNPDRHSVWIASSLMGYPDHAPPPTHTLSNLSGVTLTEYDLPETEDLPHDLMVDPRGTVVITGMRTGVMYVLTPESGTFRQVSIPVRRANPRALHIGTDGLWWVLLGDPAILASYDPRLRSWATFPVGAYPHSLHMDSDGGAWFNGGFTVNPEIIGRLDTETREVQRYEVPPPPGVGAEESTLPHGLRVGEDGTVWGTELRGNRLIRVSPETGQVDTWEMPQAHSGPRKLDIGPDGSVWIPESAGGRLVRFDPDQESFTAYDLPLRDALPYVVRIDRTRGTVWIGTGAADAVLAFEPSTRRFTVYPLPTPGALIRDLDVVEATGDVWASYSASPGIPPKILRIRRH